MGKIIISEAYNFGHEVDWCEKKKDWFFVETGETVTNESYDNLICPKCKKNQQKMVMIHALKIFQELNLHVVDMVLVKDMFRLKMEL